MQGRSCYLEIKYENKDITKSLKPYLKAWDYTDNMSGEPDDLQLTLEDTAGIWLEDWFPEKGARLEAKIVKENWSGAGNKEELPIGVFEIDEISAGSNSEICIKSLSIPQKNSLSGQKKNKAWEKTRYSVVFKDIAQKAKMEIFFDVGFNPEKDRIEQVEETDLEFIKKSCSEMGWAFKIADNKLVIFEEYKYEQEEPVMLIDRYIHGLKSWSATSKLKDIYAGVKVIYKDAGKKTKTEHNFKPDAQKNKKKTARIKNSSKNKKSKSGNEKEKTYTYKLPDAPNTDRILVIRERVSSLQEAEYKGKKALRDKNKEAWTMGMTLPCNLNLLASNTVLLKSFGKFSGKYIITSISFAN